LLSYKIVNYFIFKQVPGYERKSFEPVHYKLHHTFNPKIVFKLSKIWVWDLESEIRDSETGKNRKRSATLLGYVGILRY
jgi:hypothetical protein